MLEEEEGLAHDDTALVRCLICAYSKGQIGEPEAGLVPSSQLRNHIAAHLHYRPHLCTQCEFACIELDELLRHSKHTQHQLIQLDGNQNEYLEQVCSQIAMDCEQKQHSDENMADPCTSQQQLQQYPSWWPSTAFVGGAKEPPVTEEEVQKSNLVKSEFLKKVSERANAGGDISSSDILELDLLIVGSGDEAKKKTAPSAGDEGDKEPATEEEAQKSNLVKSEFLKKVSERANAGGGISPSGTPAPQYNTVVATTSVAEQSQMAPPAAAEQHRQPKALKIFDPPNTKQQKLDRHEGASGAASSSTPMPDGGEAVLSAEERMRELAEQMVQMERPDEDNDPDAYIYSRKFLLFLREVTRVIKTVKCPKMEEELEKFGLSRNGMPPVQQKQFWMGRYVKAKRFDSGGSDQQFKTPWQQPRVGGMGQFGGGRSLGPLAATRRGPFPIKLAQVAQQQRPEVVPRKKSANPWKSKREERRDINTPARDAEEFKYYKMRREMHGLLNKFTPSTYEELSNKFIQYKIHEDVRALEMGVDLIFDKAVGDDPRFFSLYADLCLKQVEKEGRHGSFRSEIITKCQKTFLVSNQFDEKIKELREKLGALEEGDEKGRAQLEEEIEMRKSKEKRRLLGIIRFIGQLYRHHLLVDKIIIWCAFELTKRSQTNKDEVYIEYAVELFKIVGKAYEEARLQQYLPAGKKESLSLDRIFAYLTQLKPTVSNRTRFAIMDLEELRQNNWMPREPDKGSEIIEIVRKKTKKARRSINF